MTITHAEMHEVALTLRATARAEGVVPRVHPNGFIQLNLTEGHDGRGGMRLHVWPDVEVPKQRYDATIHDHPFDMRSWVLKGTLIQQRWDVSLEPRHEAYTHEVHVASYDGLKSVLLPSGVHVAARPAVQSRIYEGDNYGQPAGTFHTTAWEGLTVTLIERKPTFIPTCRVLVPLDGEPDNDFDRHGADPAELWDIIYRALPA